MSSNPAQCEVYSIQKYVSRSVVSSANKTDRHNIPEILLKVALKRHNLKPETLGEKQKYQTFIILFTLFGKRIEPVFEMKINNYYIDA